MRLVHYTSIHKLLDDAAERKAQEVSYWSDDQGCAVCVEEDESNYHIRAFAEGDPAIRGEARYGACKPNSDSYYGFGGHTVLVRREYTIYCIGEVDANWLYERLRSGLRAMSASTFKSIEEVEAYLSPAYPVK